MGPGSSQLADLGQRPDLASVSSSVKWTSSFQLCLSPGVGAPSSWEGPQTTGLPSSLTQSLEPSWAVAGPQPGCAWEGRRDPVGTGADPRASPLASPGISEPRAWGRGGGRGSADPTARSGRTKATAAPSPYEGTRRLHGSLTRASQPPPCPERVGRGRGLPNPFACTPRHPTPPQAPRLVAGGGGDPASGARTSLSCEGLSPTPANPRPPPAPHLQAPPNTPATGSPPPR